MVTRSVGLACSRATITVMILVIDAIGRLVSASQLANTTSFVSS
jgi:hypothetical protein